MEAKIGEVFSSVQGEGLYSGARQLFIRFLGCNLKCRYCDTPHINIPYCRIEQTPGTKKFTHIKNPVSKTDLLNIVKLYNLSSYHSISLTGGEPLLHSDFLLEFIPNLPATRFGIYLETNGTLVEGLRKIINLVDIVAMDIKLPSVTGMAPMWEKHLKFLKTAAYKETFVKCVFGAQSTAKEILKAVELIKTIDRNIPLVLQPVTPQRRVEPAAAKQMLSLQMLALKELRDVRIIPQTHKIIDFL